jgi:serine/threonine protein kinase
MSDMAGEPPQDSSPVFDCVVCGTRTEDNHCPHCGALVWIRQFVVLHVITQRELGGIYIVREPNGLELMLREMKAPAEPDAHILRQWERESAMLLGLKYPHVPRFLDIFSEGQHDEVRFYRVQQIIEGENVGEQIKRFPFEEGRVREIGRQLLEFLSLVHGPKYRLVHGDVKAANVILDNEGKFWLVNWGATVLIPEPITDRKKPKAEETGVGRLNRPEADVYSVGMVLLHLLARQDPAEFLKPGEKVDLSKRLDASPQLVALVEKMIAEPSHARLAEAEAAYKRLRSVQLVKKSFGPKRWQIWVTVGGGLLFALVAIYVKVRWFGR